MAVIIINPNSTVSMTEAMLAQARRYCPEMEFEGWTSHDGPAAIQGLADGEDARAAAENRDIEAMFTAGEVLYPPCEECHLQFNPGVTGEQ